MQTTTQTSPTHTDEQFHLNHVEVEGIVTRIWARRSDVLARLAVYDEHTEIIDPEGGNNGRPKRKAHYVTVLFEEGKIAQVPVTLKRKDRIRVSGYLRDEPYSENLRRFLLKAQKVELLAELPNSDELAEIRVARVATYIVARALVQFTRT
jgi:hypothetical protein